MKFYSYLWLREDGTPRYVGKGTGKRAYVRGSHHLHPPKDKALILIFPQDSEADAIESEKELIWLFGRKDIGTGILRNMTDGGDGSSGYRHTNAALQKMSAIKKGKRPESLIGYRHSDETRKKMSESHKGKPNHQLGRKASEETRRKQSNAHKGKAPKNSHLPRGSSAARKAWDTKFLRTVAWG